MIVNPLGKPKQPSVIYYVPLVGAAAVSMSWHLHGNRRRCHGTMK